MVNTANLGGALVALGVLCAAGHASAAPRTHDGLQVRAALGFGYLSDSNTVETPAIAVPILGVVGGPLSTHQTVSGGAGALEVYVGGTPAEGLVVGGYLSAMAAPGPKVTADSGNLSVTNSDVSLNLATLGPYIDYYPDDASGLHVLGTLGYAQASLHYSANGTTASATGSGFGLGVGVGYDWWVADEWSIGILGRLQYAATSHTEALNVKWTDNVAAPALMFSGCFQ